MILPTIVKSYRKPSTNHDTLPWRGNDICPCGSKNIYSKCCGRPDYPTPYLDLPVTHPPKPKTNHGHPKCYMQFTKDCSITISKEHYISKSVLKLLDILEIRGFPWHKEGEKQILQDSNLTSNILCTRHNSALSPIDRLGCHSIDCLMSGSYFAQRESLSRRSGYYFCSGKALELWGIKTLLGLKYSKIALRNGNPINDAESFDIKIARHLLSGKLLPAPLGLYIGGYVGTERVSGLAFAPLFSKFNNKLCGLSFRMEHLELRYIFDHAKEVLDQYNFKGFTYRPIAIDIITLRRASRIILSWHPSQRTGTTTSIKLSGG